MRHYLLPLLSLALALPLAAQAQAPADTAATYKHQLGLTASPQLDKFFKANRSLPLGLLYKRQLTPNKALRIGAVGSYRYTDRYDPVPLSNRDYTDSFLSAEAYVGYEFQKVLTRRWVGYAGLDVGATHTAYRFREYSERSALVDGVLTAFAVNERTLIRTYSGFMRPLVGVRYHLRPFIYVSAEAALPVQYTHYQVRGESTVTIRDTGVLSNIGEGRSQEHRVNVGLRPVSQISVHYMFGRL